MTATGDRVKGNGSAGNDGKGSVSKDGDGMGGDPIYCLDDDALNHCTTKSLSQSLSASSLSIQSPLHCTALHCTAMYTV